MKRKGNKRGFILVLALMMVLAGIPIQVGFAVVPPAYLIKGGADVYITVPGGVLTRSDNFDPSRYQHIEIGSVFGNPAYGLDTNLFSNCGVESVILPNTLRSIGNSAFESNQITGPLVLPDSVQTIGTRAFYHNPLMMALLMGPGSQLTSIGFEAFRDTGLTGELLFPFTLVSIGEGAFYGCPLIMVSLPPSMQVIGAGAFSGYVGGPIILPANEMPKANYTYLGWKNSNGDPRDIIVPEEANLAFERSYQAIEYPITYDLGGGDNSSENPSSYTVETALTLSDPTLADHAFAGWFSDEGLTQRVTGISLGSSGSRTFYAKWADSYGITYHLNEGSNSDLNPTSYSELSTPVALEAAVKPGYRFMGWYLEAEFENLLSEIPAGTTGEVAVYARFAKEYAVAYELDGGTNDPANVAAVTALDEAFALQEPTKAGYAFLGWFSDAELTQEITEIPAGTQMDLTVYAKWTKIYIIEYVMNGGNFNEPGPTVYTAVDESLLLPEANRTGYRFAGWYLDAEFTQPVSEIPSGSVGNQRFYAKWLTLYSIEYDVPDQVNATENPRSFTAEDATIILQAASRVGAEFIGWFDLGGTQITEIPQGTRRDFLLLPRWKTTTYTLTADDVEFSPETGILSAYKSTAIDIEIPDSFFVGGETRIVEEIGPFAFIDRELKAVILPEQCKKIGVGAFAENNLKNLVIPDSVFEICDGAFQHNLLETLQLGAQVVTIRSYAFSNNRLKDLVIPDSVVDIEDRAFRYNQIESLHLGAKVDWIGVDSFDTNNLTHVVLPEKITFLDTGAFSGNQSLVPIALPANLMDGYSENHWIDGNTNTTVVEILDFMHVYGRLGTVIPYSIDYQLNGGTNSPENPASYNVHSEGVLFKAPTQYGSVFEGWFADETMTQEVTKIESGEIGDRVLYAKWRALPRYQITFDVTGDGIVTPNQPQECLQGESLTFTVVANPGSFVESTTAESGQLLENPAGGYELTDIQSDDQIAISFSNVCTVTFDSQGGSEVASIVDLPFGSVIAKPINPIRKGYDFDQWVVDLNEQEPWNFEGNEVLHHQTLYAKWTPQVLAGEILISGETKWNEVLTCELSGITNGTGNTLIQWYRGTEAILGAIQENYHLVSEDMGAMIYAVVTTSEQTGEVKSADVGPVVKATPGMPQVPILLSRSTKAISVVASAGMEYSIDNGSTWQDENQFLGLQENTEYKIVQRVKSSEMSLGSEVSEALVVSTYAKSSPNVPVGPSSASKSMETVIPQEAKGADEMIEVERNQVKVIFNGQSFVDTKGEKAAIRIEPVSLQDLNLTEDQRAEIGNLPIFDISVWLGGKRTAFESKEPIVIQFDLQGELESHKVVAVYIDETGQVQILDGFLEGTTMRFETHHLSYYGLMVVDKEFDDLAQCEWAKEAVEGLAAREIILGTGKRIFSPEEPMTRADFVTLIMRMFHLSGKTTDRYLDVPVGQYYSEAIAMAKNLQILSPEAERFEPFKVISRQDMMVILAKALKVSGNDENLYLSEKSVHDFMDADQIAPEAIEEIDFLVRADLIHGADNRIQPLAQSTRAEVAQMLYNVLRKILCK